MISLKKTIYSASNILWLIFLGSLTIFVIFTISIKYIQALQPIKKEASQYVQSLPSPVIQIEYENMEQAQPFAASPYISPSPSPSPSPLSTSTLQPQIFSDIGDLNAINTSNIDFSYDR